jgi:hypothetical protein
MLQQLLDKVAQWQRQWDQDPQPACGADAIEALRKRAKSELGADVPEDYLSLLRIANGVDWNGLSIYAAEKTPIAGRKERGKEERFIFGFVDQNLHWREYAPAKNYLVFGESGDSTYLYNTAKSEYQERDRASDSLVDTYPTFEDLITEAVNQHKLP